MPYGQERARRIAFGSAQVRVVPGLDWEALSEQSQLAKRTREVDLELGQVRELGAFPEEPYRLHRARGREVCCGIAPSWRATPRPRPGSRARSSAGSPPAPKKEVLLYVHGFNETFATAAFTAAELCHFLGREQVCAFFTWPASSSGNFLTSYTTTTESADYRGRAPQEEPSACSRTTPGVEGVQILAHSRGTALTLKAVRELGLEAIAAGKEAVDLYKIDNLVLLSPDIDVDIAAQQLTGFLSDPDLVTVWPEGKLPRVLKGRLTIYASPEDRALLVSQDPVPQPQPGRASCAPRTSPRRVQRYMEALGRMDLISYLGKRTDFFGHSYFTTNPQVSSDLIQLIRYGQQAGRARAAARSRRGRSPGSFHPNRSLSNYENPSCDRTAVS